jgi:hypothetical protein
MLFVVLRRRDESREASRFTLLLLIAEQASEDGRADITAAC